MSDRLNETRYWDEDDGPTGATMWALREIDALADGEGGWTWNDSFVLKRFRSESVNLRGLFLRVLADVRGRPLPKGVFRVDDSDWNILEVQRRRDGCPVWAMMRLTPR